MHGERSAEVSCSTGSLLCAGTLPATFPAILRNATSLEGSAGFRLELLGLRPSESNSANLYIQSRLGFLTVQNNGADVVDDQTKLALGIILTNGPFRNSYLEVGWGRTDLFSTHRGRRFKVDGYVEWTITELDKRPIHPFF